MLDSVDFSGKPFHFIGIGGIGMSALAYVLARRNLPVSGSDLRLSHITQRLQEQNVHIFWSQVASNLEFFQSIDQILPGSQGLFGSMTGATGNLVPVEIASIIDFDTKRLPEAWRSRQLPQVVCSTAIHPDNAEYQAARDLGCPIFHRSDILAALFQEYQGIAVSGTHGKTTTSSMIGYLLVQAGLDPTVVIGGEVSALGGNARLGQGDYLVAEADESDGSLVKFAPAIGIVTNLELDHPDHYKDLAQVIDIFQTFTDRCQTVIGCIDCANVKTSLNPEISYSVDIHSGADYTVDCITYRADGTTARVWERGAILGQLNVKLLGQHNLSNALAAVAVGRLLKLDFAVIATAIATFEGARRRFELRGQFNGIRFVDDYAHHPSEIEATLTGARLQAKAGRSGKGRVVAIFQPHRYSRTLTFLAEFATAFADADVVVITDIYSAGEANPGNITGQDLADAIGAHHANVHYCPSHPAVSQLLTDLLRPEDLALFLGAGNLNQLIPEAMAYFQGVEQRLAEERCNRA